MQTTGMKLAIGGNYMPAVSEHIIQRQLSAGQCLFQLDPVPTRDVLCDTLSTNCIEVQALLAGRKWTDIAISDELALNYEGGDLADTFINLSRVGLLYYLPGFLLHFLRNGTYDANLSGPDFYYAFIRRIQCDSAQVSLMGGCQEYFDLSNAQRNWCGEVMREIYIHHGDSYESFDHKGYEYSDLAQCSIARALAQYWKADI